MDKTKFGEIPIRLKMGIKKITNIKIRKEKHFVEYIFDSSNNYIGKIIIDEDRDYIFKKGFLEDLGKGKCLKEIAERLIELNYTKEGESDKT